MNFLLSADLTTTDQTLSLKASGMDSLAAIAAFPMYILVTRSSDGATEVMQILLQSSSTDGTVLRGQLNSTAITFSTNDTAQYLNTPTFGTLRYFLLGNPAATSANGWRVAVTLSGSPQTITTSITNPSVARVPTIAGNAGGITGDVTLTCVDKLGATFTQTLALSGTATVAGTKAAAQITQIVYPVQTHGGTDTVVVGWNDALGLPAQISRNQVEKTYYGSAVETTLPTVTFGSTIADCTIDLNTVLAGSAVSLWMIIG